MTHVFASYAEASSFARHRATATGLRQALRGVSEYGRRRYVVAFAAPEDHGRAEIIAPGEPV